MRLISLTAAYILDLIFGDPYSFPHPVRYIGRLIRWTEKKIRTVAKRKKALIGGGLVLWLVTVGTTFGVVSAVVELSKIQMGVYLVVNSVLLYTTLATKCLGDEANKIKKVLQHGTIEEARVQLSYIVGRDTSQLSATEIIRATVETVAENTVDGIVAPMLYGFIGGAPLAFVYKAINTLDSTVGYKNEKYKEIGFVSAKIDDVANYIPARITAFLMTVAAFLLRLDAKNCLKIAMRDRKNHKSPNCAYSEGAVAGALGVQLGGTNIYFGEKVYKPTIGDHLRDLEIEDITRTNRMMYMTSFVSFVIFSLISLVIVKMI